MRTRSILLLVTIGLLLTAMPAAAEKNFVAHVGVNISTYHMDDLYSDAREGATAGVEYAIAIAENWRLVPGLWWGQRGYKEGTLWEDIGIQGRTQNLTVPVMVQYWFPADSADPRIFAGLSVDFVLKSEISQRREEDWYDVTDQDESAYFGLVLGGGVRLFGWFDIDGRYYHAFTPVTSFDYVEFDDIIPEYWEFDDAYDRTWVLSGGVWF